MAINTIISIVALIICLVVGVALTLIFLKLRKTSTSKKLKKTTYAVKIEEEIVLLKEAVKGLARNNGQEFAPYITDLSKYDVEAEELERLLKATYANRAKVSGTKKDLKANKKLNNLV